MTSRKQYHQLAQRTGRAWLRMGAPAGTAASPESTQTLCGHVETGGTPIRVMRCDREAGHAGWHNESATGSSWPPKKCA